MRLANDALAPDNPRAMKTMSVVDASPWRLNGMLEQGWTIVGCTPHGLILGRVTNHGSRLQTRARRK